MLQKMLHYVARRCMPLAERRPGDSPQSAEESGGNEFFQFPVAGLWPLELQFAKKPRFITMLGSHRRESRFLARQCGFLIE